MDLCVPWYEIVSIPNYLTIFSIIKYQSIQSNNRFNLILLSDPQDWIITYSMEAYMGITRFSLPHNDGSLPLPIFLLDNIY